MATLWQYFDVDFRNLLNADLIGSALCGENAGEAVARARFDFDAGVKFASHYPAPRANATQVIRNLEEQFLLRPRVSRRHHVGRGFCGIE